MSKTSPHGKKKIKTPGYDPMVSNGAGLAAHGIRVGFPAERTVSLVYSDYDTLTSSTGVLAKYQYRLNSAFDPDYTGTGHQPMGFDQWSAYYNHYCVESVDYEVQMLPSGTVYTNTATYLSDDVTVPTNFSEISELGGVVAFGSPYSSTNSHIYKGRVNIAQFFNRKNIASDPELRALTSANPTEVAYLTLFAANADPVQGQAFYFGIKLTYKVRFMEPKDLAPSLAVLQRSPSARQVTSVVPDDTKGDGEYVYVRTRVASTVILPGQS
jgi:hypothetical protein